MHFNDFLSAALGIVSIATLAGLGFMRGTVTNLREQLKDCRDELSSLKTSRDEVKAENKVLAADVDALGRAVRGEAHWIALEEAESALAAKLDEHHAEASRHWRADEKILSDIRDTLRRKGS